MLLLRMASQRRRWTMSTRPPTDIPAALEAARRPVQAPKMPRVGLRLTLRTSPVLHRLLPRRLAVWTAELRGQALWRRHPDARESSRATMQAILAGTRRAREL
jgi:hypothetical protein